MRIPEFLRKCLLKWADGVISSRAPDFTIKPVDIDYLQRWWILRTRKFASIYLHKFLHSDEDRALHDHPWINCSTLLSGNYKEHTPKGEFIREEGHIYFRRSTSRHRVELPNDENGNPKPVKTLFLTGPVIRTWGFWCPKGFVPWRDFVDGADKGKIGRGCE